MLSGVMLIFGKRPSCFYVMFVIGWAGCSGRGGSVDCEYATVNEVKYLFAFQGRGEDKFSYQRSTGNKGDRFARWSARNSRAKSCI